MPPARRLSPLQIGLAAVVAAAAAWGLLGVLRLGKGDAPPAASAPAGSATGPGAGADPMRSPVGVPSTTPTRSGAIDVTPRPRPATPEIVDARPSTGSPAADFAAEAREEEWAAANEAALGIQIAALHLGGTARVECRSTVCAVELTNVEAPTTALAALEAALGGKGRELLVSALPAPGQPWRLHLRVR